MIIVPHHVTFGQRNSCNNTFLNASMCTNRNSDVNLQEAANFTISRPLGVRTEIAEASDQTLHTHARGNSKKCLLRELLQHILSGPQRHFDVEWQSWSQKIVADHVMITITFRGTHARKMS